MLFNRPRAIDYMRQCGVDVLVATSPVNITYFTDYFSWMDSLFKEYMMSPGASSSLAQGYAVFPLEGEPALIVSPLNAVNARDLWVREVHCFGASGLDESLSPNIQLGAAQLFYDLLHAPNPNATSTAELLSLLKARGLADARIGIEMEGLTPKAHAALAGALPKAQVKDCSNLIRLIRAVKSDEEIHRLARSAEINEQVAMECLAMAKPGGRALDLAHHYRSRAAELGADFDHFAFGIGGLGIATEPDYIFTKEDILFVDFGCVYQRYFSDSGTTLALCPPSPTLLERHSALRACVEAAVNQIRPGVPASVVRGAMWQTLNAQGITATFPHGHGLGLELRDYPIVVPNNGLRLCDNCIDVPSDLPLEPNMVFNLEAAIFSAGVASLHIEKTFVVTADGCRPLTSQNRSAPFQPHLLH